MDRYEEALERAKKGLPIDEVFPELKETKSERIRRCLLVWIKNSDYTGISGIPKDDVISWFEKQKEYVSNNFDEVWEREDCSEILAEGKKLTPEFKALFKKVCHAFFDKGVELTKKQKEQKPVECIEFDNEFKNQISHLFASILNKEWKYDKNFVEYVAQQLLEYAKYEIKPKQEWSEDERIRKWLIAVIEEVKTDDDWCADLNKCDEAIAWLEKKNPANDVYPKKLNDAIKLYYETYGNGKGGFDYMSYTKFEDIVKTFVNDYGCQKPAEWSEKDKECRDELIQYIEQRIGDGTTGQSLWKKWHSWLKALPERFNLQSHWKPSKEQIDALEWMLTTVSMKDGGRGVVLKNLINDLKKQM